MGGFLSPFLYRDPLIQEMIHQLKYERVSLIAPIFGTMLAEYALSYVPKDYFSLLVPIPLFPARERVRGFNQSLRIAQPFSRITGIPLRPELIFRIKKKRPQVGLSYEERRRNIAGAFAVRDSSAVKNMTILLLDDVKTGGSTLEEASRVCKKAGAKEVWGITVAH